MINIGTRKNEIQHAMTKSDDYNGIAEIVLPKKNGDHSPEKLKKLAVV